LTGIHVFTTIRVLLSGNLEVPKLHYLLLELDDNDDVMRYEWLRRDREIPFFRQIHVVPSLLAFSDLDCARLSPLEEALDTNFNTSTSISVIALFKFRFL
jgi:hypothetical protein